MSNALLSNIWVVIIHYEVVAATKLCLESLFNITDVTFKALVVNNGCSIEQSKNLQISFPEVYFLNLPQNLGYAGGANCGIKYCQDNGAEFIWLLNNDIEVDCHALTCLVQEALRLPGSGILSAGLVKDFAKPRGIVSGVGRICYWKAKSYLGNVTSLEPQDCEWLSGCNLFFRVEAIRNKQLFDERYFLYFEDTEFCVRMNRHGWKCTLIPQARVMHKDGGSFNEERLFWRSYYHTRNRALFFSTYQSKPYLAIINWCFILAHELKHLITLTAKGRQRQLMAELNGLSDFFMGRFGRLK